jgi:hypothetical protein
MWKGCFWRDAASCSCLSAGPLCTFGFRVYGLAASCSFTSGSLCTLHYNFLCMCVCVSVRVSLCVFLACMHECMYFCM